MISGLLSPNFKIVFIVKGVNKRSKRGGESTWSDFSSTWNLDACREMVNYWHVGLAITIKIKAIPFKSGCSQKNGFYLFSINLNT